MTDYLYERQLERDCVKEASVQGWVCFKLDVGHAPRNRLDQVLLKNGTGAIVEFKMPGQKPTRKQQFSMRVMRAAGVPVAVVTSLSEFTQFLLDLEGKT